MTTPVVQYTTRSMLRALSQGNRPTHFLRDMFVGKDITHETEEIQIDVQKGGDTIAAYVSRDGGPNEISKRKYSSNIHAVPYVYESITYTPKELKDRSIGENIFESGGKNKVDRLTMKMAEGLEDLSARLDRLEEKQVSEAMQTGKVVVSGKDVNYTVDYQMDADHLIDTGAGEIWSDSSHDILSQLKTAAQLIKESGAPAATDLILGDTAAINFLQNATIKELLDIKNYNIGSIDIDVMNEKCASYLGTIKWPGVVLKVWNYHAKYENAAGTAVSYIDPVNAVMGSPNARMEFHYGLIESLANTFGVKRWPVVIMAPNGKNAIQSMESAPLVGFHQPDGFARIKTEL